MVPDMETARRFAFLSRREEAVLSSWRRPILLARQRRVLASAINEGYCTLGLMLPFQPVHYHIFSDTGLKALVFTSGNKKGYPLCADDDEAVVQLLEGTDILVTYNRSIYNRVDDSVVRVIADAPRLLRRARGYVPDPLPADMSVEEICSMMSYEEAGNVIVPIGTCKGWTLAQVSDRRPASLKWYINGYSGNDNILRAAATIMQSALDIQKAS